MNVMKRMIVVLLLAVGACSFATAQEKPAAEDSYFLNHLAVGVGAGLDGVSAEIAFPFTRNFIFRAGYGTFSFVEFAKYSRSVRVDADSPWTIHDNISGTVRPTMDNLHLLLDFFPSRKGAFHFTLGVYTLLNANGIFHASTDQPLPIPSVEYASTGIEITQDGRSSYVTTDANGYLQADLGTAMGRLLPYAGIGFSRAVSDGRLRLLMDLGVLYTEKYKVQSYDYGIRGSLENPLPVELSPSLLQGYDQGVVERIQSIPVYPVLKFSLFLRLF